MLYYHVYVDMDGEETEETDLSLETLTKHIVGLYNQSKKFMCKGMIIYPSEVTTIRIIETEQSAANVLSTIKKGRSLITLYDRTDFQLLEEQGRDVTREFIQTEAKRQKKKMMRKKTVASFSKDVFIVHGRDHGPMGELKAMLREFGLNPIVLHEQPSGSRTIVEKLEKYSEVGYAFVILTPDDTSLSWDQFSSICNDLRDIIMEEERRDADGSINQRKIFEIFQKNTQRRARQNVILEFGYFMGLLERDRVCCLHKGGVELPSDMHGIVYIPFSDSIIEIEKRIIEELKEAGYEIKI
jgi:predicted nucleotide-binding protein